MLRFPLPGFCPICCFFFFFYFNHWRIFGDAKPERAFSSAACVLVFLCFALLGRNGTPNVLSVILSPEFMRVEFSNLLRAVAQRLALGGQVLQRWDQLSHDESSCLTHVLDTRNVIPTWKKVTRFSTEWSCTLLRSAEDVHVSQWSWMHFNLSPYLSAM